MSRPDSAPSEDIAQAIDSIRSHLEHGPISVGIVMDAVAMRLLEIGEAANGLSLEVTASEPDVDWRGIAGMRDFLAHHYFATRPDIIQMTNESIGVFSPNSRCGERGSPGNAPIGL